MLACLEAIGAGEVYQACVCTQYAGTVTGSPLDFFADTVARLAPARPRSWPATGAQSPRCLPNCSCAGPERRSVPAPSRALPLHADPDELRASTKDVAENVMIVDLVRNDLSRVAQIGSVTVPELLTVKRAPVWHLVSTVAAQVAVDVSAAELLRATFPPASVTGTPKARAQQLLSQWETRRRGVYCGTVGLASPVAGCELNVAIRTVEFAADGTGYWASAAESQPTPNRMPSGRNACTRQRRFWGPTDSGAGPHPRDPPTS